MMKNSQAILNEKYGLPVEIINGDGYVKCSFCRGVYLNGLGEQVARYSDCTLFKAPCCGATVDDRLWKSLPDFTKLTDSSRISVYADGTAFLFNIDGYHHRSIRLSSFVRHPAPPRGTRA